MYSKIPGGWIDGNDTGDGSGAGMVTSGAGGVARQLNWGSANSSDDRLGNKVLIFLPADGANGADFGCTSVFSTGSLGRK